MSFFFFFFQAEDGIRDHCVTGVQTCALPISHFLNRHAFPRLVYRAAVTNHPGGETEVYQKDCLDDANEWPIKQTGQVSRVTSHESRVTSSSWLPQSSQSPARRRCTLWPARSASHFVGARSAL